MRFGSIVATAAIYLLLSSLAVAASDEARERFDRLDGDGDGVITKGEFGTNKVIFVTMLDVDGDNKLSKEEIRLSDDAFAELDRDKDGKIDGYEFVASPLVQFEKIDLDRDGVVTFEEFSRYRDKLRAG